MQHSSKSRVLTEIFHLIFHFFRVKAIKYNIFVLGSIFYQFIKRQVLLSSLMWKFHFRYILRQNFGSNKSVSGAWSRDSDLPMEYYEDCLQIYCIDVAEKRSRSWMKFYIRYGNDFLSFFKQRFYSFQLSLGVFRLIRRIDYAINSILIPTLKTSWEWEWIPTFSDLQAAKKGLLSFQMTYNAIF